MIVSALFSVGQVASAGPYEDGFAAYKQRDYATALKLLRPLAEQGNAGAQNVLGVMYEMGRGAAQSDIEAVKWYRLAAEQGDAGAQNSLGLMYDKGQGVAQDYVRAHMWFNLATASLSVVGAKTATDNRNRISAQLTPEQIDRAQEMARECRQSKLKGCGAQSDAPAKVQADARASELAGSPAANGESDNKPLKTPAGVVQVIEKAAGENVLTLNGKPLKTESGELLEAWSVDIHEVLPSRDKAQFLVITTSTGGNACNIWGLHLMRVVPPVWLSDDLGACGLGDIKAFAKDGEIFVEALSGVELNEFGDPYKIMWRYANGNLRVMPRKGVPDFWRHETNPPSEFLGQADIRAPIARVLRDRYRDVRDRLTVSSGMEVVSYRYLVGSGCMPHSCAGEGAMLIVDAYNGNTWAFYVEDERMGALGPASRHVFVPSHLPPLKKWLDDWGVELETSIMPIRVRPKTMER